MDNFIKVTCVNCKTIQLTNNKSWESFVKSLELQGWRQIKPKGEIEWQCPYCNPYHKG